MGISILFILLVFDVGLLKWVSKTSSFLFICLISVSYLLLFGSKMDQLVHGLLGLLMGMFMCWCLVNVLLCFVHVSEH